MHKVSVQTQDFNVGNELSAMQKERSDIGAVVNFIGYVRDLNDGDNVSALTLEHYPEMTEKALMNIVEQACSRWDIFASTVIHRVGTLLPSEQIVMVAMASAHRQSAFEACNFVMDYLKTEAPFWKKEETSSGSRWVEAKESDDAAKQRWD